jgi:hypothetical protein
MSIRTTGLLFALAIFFAVTLPPAKAGMLPDPVGPVVLTVDGRIAATNAGPLARFDMAMLETLPGRRTVTATPWTKTTDTFEGPLISALLDRLGATGTVLHIEALHDYAVDLPLSDVRDWPVILATRKDGKAMSVRDKGPLLIVYPFDLDRSLYNERVFARSVWQVRAIQVR